MWRILEGQPAVSILDKRWALAAQELQFQQLDGARRLAESWRTGLGGLTSLFAVVTIVKGQDSITALTTGTSVFVGILVGIAFISLLAATLLAVWAASGAPDDSVRLTGEDLKAWTRYEIRRIRVLIRWAISAMVLGLALVVMSVALTWFGPVDKSSEDVQVVTANQRFCGELLRADSEGVTLDLGRPIRIRMDDVIALTPGPCG